MMRYVGVQELIVLFLVALLLFGPRGPRRLADDVGKTLQEWRQWNPPWQPRRNTSGDWAALSVIVLVAVALSWR